MRQTTQSTRYKIEHRFCRLLILSAWLSLPLFICSRSRSNRKSEIVYASLSACLPPAFLLLFFFFFSRQMKYAPSNSFEWRSDRAPPPQAQPLASCKRERRPIESVPARLLWPRSGSFNYARLPVSCCASDCAIYIRVSNEQSRLPVFLCFIKQASES